MHGQWWKYLRGGPCRGPGDRRDPGERLPGAVPGLGADDFRGVRGCDRHHHRRDAEPDSAGGGGGAGGRGGENRPGKWLNGRLENPGLTSSGDFSIMNNNHMV